MNDNLQFEVIIIGGGPAGIATSLTLASQGISHCIVEALPEPIRKPGEAIPPDAKPLLQKLGLDKLLENEKHLPYYGAQSCWGSDQLQQEEFLKNINGHGYLLDRLFFEEQLRETVQNIGVKCFFGYRLINLFEKEDQLFLEITDRNQSKTLQAQFIVDATGRKASVCRHLGIPIKQTDDLFCLSFHILKTVSIPKQIWVETTSNGWWYAAPFGNDHLSFMFFTKKELLPIKEDTIIFLKNEFQKTIHLQKLVPEISIDLKNLKTFPAGTAALDIPFGKNWIAVGDAAYAFDPISSYGITSALASGYYGGNALADFLKGKKEGLEVYRYIMETAFQTYLKELGMQYAVEMRWKKSIFWNY